MKSLDEESRVFAWGRVYRWAAIIGAILGGLWAIYYLTDIWGPQARHVGLARDPTFRVIIQLITTAIVLLAVPVGAMCGAALAALLHLMVWDANTAKELQMLKARKLAAETDHGRGDGAPQRNESEEVDHSQ